MTSKEREFAFVQDLRGTPLSPTPKNNAWCLIRKKKATLIQKFPMIIKLNKVIPIEDCDTSKFYLGIDDGSKEVGLSIVQKCLTRNKVVFKGVIELRSDVTHLMDVRRGYRRWRRQHKRYRKPRFLNRASSRREGRISPSIKQKKDAILRVVRNLFKWVPVTDLTLEDVKIDIRALVEGYRPYNWEYQRSNRLDENLRKATLLRDRNGCKMCRASDCMLEIHHIIPRRLRGSDSIYNLVTLCSPCHRKVTGIEEDYIDFFQDLIKGSSVNSTFAQHVMQGKTYLRSSLEKLAPLQLVSGGDTSNYRVDLNILKSHSNDATVMNGLFITPEDCCIREWKIRPQRKRSKAKTASLNGFKHRDYVCYRKRNGARYFGWITALYPDLGRFNMTTIHGIPLKKYTIKSLSLLWRFNKIQWL